MKTKRFLSILLSLALVLGTLPGMGMTAFAEDNTTTITPSNTSGKMTITLKIKPAQTIMAYGGPATFGDTDKSVTALTFGGGGEISYAVKSGSEDYIDVDASTGALTIKAVPKDGVAYVTVTAAETDEYAQTTQDVAISIDKAEAVAPTVIANNRTHDGTEKPLVTVEGEPTGGTMYYALGENATTPPADNSYTTSIPEATDTGNYYVWYVKKGDENHEDLDPKCVTVMIKESYDSDKVPGTGALRDPGAPTDAGWNGDYVYYGKYNGINPTKYRVLDKDAAEFGGKTMFLDCDSILYYDYFKKDKSSNAWADSDVKTGLNGEKFLEKTGNFSDIEKAAIASSTVSEHDLVKADDKNKNEEGKVAPWVYDSFGKYVPLDKDKVFLLDMEDVSNIKYGYRMTDSDGPERLKKDQKGEIFIWFLRSANTELNYCVGCCMHDLGYQNGDLNRNDVNSDLGISPAFNVDLGPVIFTSLIPDTSNEYKLTLLDNDIKITTKDYSKSGDTVTVPYTLSGNHAANVTRISVLLTDKPYSSGTDMTDGYAYEKLDVETGGTGTFTIPDSFKDKEWGEDYHVYILAEDENYGNETDYASAPAELYTVTKEKTSAKVTGYEGIYDGKAHGIDIKVTNPQDGATVKYGEKEGTYNLDASPVITNVSDSPKTVYYKISADGYRTSFGSSQIKIKKATSGIKTAPEAKTGLVYNEDKKELVSPGTAEGGELRYALEKEGVSGVSDYTANVPSAKDAGTYYVWYKVKGDSNHNDTEPKCVTVTIKSSGGSGSDSSDAIATQEVVDKIGDLKEPYDEAKVKEAREAYNKLTDDQKKKVSEDTLKKLTDAETALAEAQVKSVKAVTVNAGKINAKTVNKAVAKAGGSSKYVKNFVIGKNVKKISKGAFKNYKNAKTLVVKTRKLKKSTVKNSLKGSKITKVKVKVGNKKTNKKYVKKYKTIFTKKNAGRKVKVSL